MFFHQIIDKYYPADDNLRRLLLHHSRQVADRALAIVRRHPELGADPVFVEDAAMIHDIGIFLTDAPGIHCCGSQPYLLHGRLGAELLRREAEAIGHESSATGVTAAYLERLARVCERHTGTGLTAETIRMRHIPLPEQDFVPETIEEIIVCYADKFYSKSHPERERTVEQTARSLEGFGHAGVEKFMQWASMFE